MNLQVGFAGSRAQGPEFLLRVQAPFEAPWGCTGFKLNLDPYWLLAQLLNFWGSYKVVDAERFNFISLCFGPVRILPPRSNSRLQSQYGCIRP